jgi:hypothetical protein
MITGSGKLLQGAEFVPGCGIEFHAVQQNDILPFRLTGLKDMQATGCCIYIFFYDINHFKVT